MAVVRRPARLRFLVAFLVLVSLTLITLDASGHGKSALQGARNAFNTVLTPVQSGIHAALRPVGNFLTGAADYGQLQAENRRLRSELAQVRASQVAAGFAQQQADQVLALHHLPFASGIRDVTAQVINVSGSNFSSTLTVDRGRDSGVVLGQPVVAAGGLAGSVSAVTAHTATIKLLTDPSFVVGVHLPGGNTGQAAGRGGSSPLQVTVLPASAPAPRIHKGQVLVTSGLSMEGFPAGIPVGRVTAVSTPPGETEPVATLRPLVAPAQLGYVDILLWSAQ